MSPIVPRFDEDNLLPGQILKEHDADNRQVIAPPASMVCDFCRATPIVWLYGCGEVTMSSVLAYDKHSGVVRPEDHKSDDAWAACAECKFLIDRSEVKKLADRSARAALANLREEQSEAVEHIPLARMRRELMHFQQVFWRNRRRSEDRAYVARRHGPDPGQ